VQTASQIFQTPVLELVRKEDQYLAIAIQNSTDELVDTRLLSKNLIHFYFCLEGTAVFEFSPHYSRELTGGKNYFIFDPTRDLEFQLKLRDRCKLVLLSITLEGLHRLFIDDPHELQFLRSEGNHQKFYDERDIPPSLVMVLSQLFTKQLSESAQRLFYQGKVLEILSEYFSNRKPNLENCPFLNNETVVRKLKHAKDFILENLETPPSLKEIARMAGLNEHQLKVGFKELFGNTVYGYILSHRLDNARMLLDGKQLQVKEVSYRIGYANTSHFIAAFKKKFGITPKQYLKQRG
jgi:AraC-like DNA-binding protein